MNKHEIEQSIEMLQYHAMNLSSRKVPDTIEAEQAREIVRQLKRIVADIWTIGIILEKIKEQNSETKH